MDIKIAYDVKEETIVYEEGRNSTDMRTFGKL